MKKIFKKIAITTGSFALLSCIAGNALMLQNSKAQVSRKNTTDQKPSYYFHGSATETRKWRLTFNMKQTKNLNSKLQNINDALIGGATIYSYFTSSSSWTYGDNFYNNLTGGTLNIGWDDRDSVKTLLQGQNKHLAYFEYAYKLFKVELATNIHKNLPLVFEIHEIYKFLSHNTYWAMAYPKQ